MSSNQQSTKTIGITACITVAAATFALVYVLVPTSAQAEEENTAINMAARKVSEQRTAGVAGISLPVNINTNVISGNVLTNASGIMAVNMAAGDKNQQQNVAILELNSQGAGAAQAGNLQGSTHNSGPMQSIATTRIEDNSFSNASGILAVNQISGFANNQANSATIVIGIQGEQITDSVLAGTSPDTAGTVMVDKNNTASRRDVSISETAFQNVSGVVQLNQTAGSHNDSANNFSLRLGGAP